MGQAASCSCWAALSQAVLRPGSSGSAMSKPMEGGHSSLNPRSQCCSHELQMQRGTARWKQPGTAFPSSTPPQPGDIGAGELVGMGEGGLQLWDEDCTGLFPAGWWVAVALKAGVGGTMAPLYGLAPSATTIWPQHSLVRKRMALPSSPQADLGACTSHALPGCVSALPAPPG